MSATSPSAAVPPFRGRIGDDPRSGYYAAPHRYRLHLSLTCPHCLQIAVTHSLLGLADVLPVTLLPAVPDAPDGGHRALRPLYEASAHLYPGPALAPVLHDNWTGTVVSTNAPDIVRDLARRFGGHGDCLLPLDSDEAFAAVERLCEQGVHETAQRAGLHGGDRAERDTALATLLRALDVLELRLASREYVLGDDLTLADVRLWVTLVQLDTVHRHHLDASAVHRITEHLRLWAYARRLTAHPAFGPHLDLDGIARRHHAHCRGTEAAGAAVPIMDWPAYVDRRAPEPIRRSV
ncbi:glutathione S-transferase C-terminal domain-containing protein [Streptomyces sp. AC04842]|uniref:glutathione S-transferase C-terminal domain-containing protein n=1 Tax=Streptomyces sp. AC04842 TaxID=2775327 RepID=UPI0020C6989E|nr:glutathione S-transferase C-terminal domain-containing protein [Streptomyces sp. AC04842]